MQVRDAVGYLDTLIEHCLRTGLRDCDIYMSPSNQSALSEQLAGHLLTALTLNRNQPWLIELFASLTNNVKGEM